ncbi:hypothetical protein H4582DRAFT_2129911 [Lactarius indigo]|nr:hypothetical protein H4582DRAFT_2129911 [Lactarius indigo]
MASHSQATTDTKRKIIQILLIFYLVSQSDVHVRNALGTRKVVRRGVRACGLLEPECPVDMFNAIKHLSMNGMLLKELQNADVIEILTRILDEQRSRVQDLTARYVDEKFGFIPEMSNHIFQTYYNFCRLNKGRQEEVAQASIKPLLMRVIESTSSSGTFPSILLTSRAWGRASRRDRSGKGRTSEAQVARRAPRVLRLRQAGSFEILFDPFLKICRHSTPIAIGIAKAQFLRRITEKLSNSKAVVKPNLLRVLRAVCDVYPNCALLVKRYGIHETVAVLRRKDREVNSRERSSRVSRRRDAPRAILLAIRRASAHRRHRSVPAR